MSTKELKEHIHTLVEQVPEDYLESVKSYLTSLSKDEFVLELGITLSQYNEELDAAVARYKAGKSIAHEDAISIVNERLEKYRRGA